MNDIIKNAYDRYKFIQQEKVRLDCIKKALKELKIDIEDKCLENKIKEYEK